MASIQNEHLVEHIFRHEYGKIISFLINKFGPSYLEIVEDAVQESLIAAMQIWAYNKLPDNPTAWLLRVANNKIIDSLRKNKKMVHYDVISHFDDKQSVRDEVHLNDIIYDSQLKMIFACCHPSLSQEYQIILSLKLIGGFGNKEIAKALLKKEETVAKSFTRAKVRLKNNVKTLEIPVELGLKSRLSIVLKIIYLLFSEGYATSSGTNLIKKDICAEAIRLALLLSTNKYCNQPEVHALIALMCFHTARFEARVDGKGEIVDLENQNRGLYDLPLIKKGIEHLKRSAVNTLPSDYHLQAAISYFHCTAKKFSETDWHSILQLYDLQLRKQYSPIVQLNRIVPYHKVYGADLAMKELQEFEKSPHFSESVLYHALKAELLAQLNDMMAAEISLEKAIALTHNESEKKHLQKKLRLLKKV